MNTCDPHRQLSAPISERRETAAGHDLEQPLTRRNAEQEDVRGRTIFRHLRRLVGGYLVLSLVTLVVIAVLRNDRSAVNSAVWIRGTIVALSSMLTFRFTVRASLGSARAFLRLRIVSAVMLGAIAVIIALPGTFPLWMKLEQAVCGLLLVSVVALVNDHRVRVLFSATSRFTAARASARRPRGC